MSSKEMEMKASAHDVSEADADAVAQVAAAVTEAAAGEVVTGYKKIEDGVVNGYLKIQDGVVDGFGKVVDKCVEVLFARDGESVEEAKDRLSGKNKE